jgi:hypothetical protein
MSPFNLGRELVKAEDLAIDDAKEESWMAVYEHERDLLEDIVLSRPKDRGSARTCNSPCHGPAQLLCAQQVWESLLTVFPLKLKDTEGRAGTLRFTQRSSNTL